MSGVWEFVKQVSPVLVPLLTMIVGYLIKASKDKDSALLESARRIVGEMAREVVFLLLNEAQEQIAQVSEGEIDAVAKVIYLSAEFPEWIRNSISLREFQGACWGVWFRLTGYMIPKVGADVRTALSRVDSYKVRKAQLANIK